APRAALAIAKPWARSDSRRNDGGAGRGGYRAARRADEPSTWNRKARLSGSSTGSFLGKPRTSVRAMFTQVARIVVVRTRPSGAVKRQRWRRGYSAGGRTPTAAHAGAARSRRRT